MEMDVRLRMILRFVIVRDDMHVHILNVLE